MFTWSLGWSSFFPASSLPPVGHHLVHVHVGLGAASGLPYGKGEMGVQLPLQDFVADLRNDLKTSFVQLPQTMVCHGGAFFKMAKRG